MSLDDTEIRKSDSYQYLGALMDKTLTIKDYFVKIYTKGLLRATKLSARIRLKYQSIDSRYDPPSNDIAADFALQQYNARHF